MFGSSLIPLLILGSLRVQVSATCPTADQIHHSLRALVSESFSDDRVEVSDGPDGLEILFKNSVGHPLAARFLAKEGSCSDLASAVAVIVSTWMTDLGRGVPPPPPLYPGSVALAVAKKRPLLLELEAGFVASVAEGGPAVGASAAVSLWPTDSFGVFIGARAVGARNRPLGPGVNRWQRTSAVLGPEVRLSLGRIQLDLFAELLLAILTVRGLGYARNNQGTDADPGVGVGAKAAMRFGSWVPFLGVSVVDWLRAQTIRVEGLEQSDRLPGLEVFFTAGVDWRIP
jgi:hypothetical protein